MLKLFHKSAQAVADPGFSVGGDVDLLGRQPPTQALFGENVCENERIGSCWGRTLDTPLDPPMTNTHKKQVFSLVLYYNETSHNFDALIGTMPHHC